MAHYSSLILGLQDFGRWIFLLELCKRDRAFAELKLQPIVRIKIFLHNLASWR